MTMVENLATSRPSWQGEETMLLESSENARDEGETAQWDIQKKKNMPAARED